TVHGGHSEQSSGGAQPWGSWPQGPAQQYWQGGDWWSSGAQGGGAHASGHSYGYWGGGGDGGWAGPSWHGHWDANSWGTSASPLALSDGSYYSDTDEDSLSAMSDAHWGDHSGGGGQTWPSRG
ncbi:unnamed protein product, partial [Symbiodinium natans]